MTIHTEEPDVLANALYTSLTQDAPTPPTVDLTDDQYSFTADADSGLYDTPGAITLEDLTCGELEGTGVYDKLMASVDLHIEREYKDGRLTGDQYAKAYTSIMVAVLDQSTKFLLTKDAAKWESIKAQMEARISEIRATEAILSLEKTKAEVSKMIFDMKNSGAQYALTKMQLANADAEHHLVQAKTVSEEYKNSYILPADLAILEFNRSHLMPSALNESRVKVDRILPAEAALKEFEHRVLQPLEESIQAYQINEVLPTQTDIQKFQLLSILPVTLGQEQHKLNFQMPAQTQLLDEQKETARAATLDTRSDALTPVGGLLGRQASLLSEQFENERSKTMDTRSDGPVIVGSVGKQKDLYSEQIQSFVKDAKHKTAKMYLDAWITQKTLDEGLTAPTELQNTAINAVIASVRATNNLT